MFTRLRLQLTAQFMLLSIVVYVVLAATGCFIFYSALTKDLDLELEEESKLAASLVKVEDKEVSFSEYKNLSKANRFHIKPTIQLWDQNKVLVASLGTPGKESFFQKTTEFEFKGKNLRTVTKPIKVSDSSAPIYIQIQMNTGIRDQALNQFLYSATLTIPVLLLGLGLGGYYFSGLAVRPVQDSFESQKLFLADAGHELKTPIAVIRASVDNLLHLDEEEKLDKSRVKRISKSVSRIEKLVSDLLLLTKTEQGLGQLEFAELELDMVIREVLGEIEDFFEDKEVKLETGDIDSIKMTGNRQALYTVFTNLVKNAMIYTDEGGTVFVSLKQSGTKAEVKIKDTGIGISKENLPKLFDRFFRADQSRTESGSGGSNGLGLAIVKAIVDKHSGKIDVQSEINKGTTFLVSLPIR